MYFDTRSMLGGYLRGHIRCARSDSTHGVHDTSHVWSNRSHIFNWQAWTVCILSRLHRHLHMPPMRNSNMLSDMLRRTQNAYGLLWHARKSEIYSDEPLHAWNNDG